MKSLRLAALILVSFLCISILCSCSAKTMREYNKDIERPSTMLAEKKDWIDTESQLGILLSESMHCTNEDGFSIVTDKKDILRIYDFSNNSFNDIQLPINHNSAMIYRNAAPGFALVSYDENGKCHEIYEFKEDFSIVRKINPNLKDAIEIYGWVDEWLYYEVFDGVDEGPLFSYNSSFFRQSLLNGKIESLDIDIYNSIDKRGNILATRYESMEYPDKDGVTTTKEPVYEIGILNFSGEWISIAHAGCGHDFDYIESSCWLDENRVLLLMSPTDSFDTMLYIYDLESDKLNPLLAESGSPICLYIPFNIDRTMYPDPSGEYIACILYDYYRELNEDKDLDSVYLLSLKTGQSCKIIENQYIANECKQFYQSIKSGMLIWQ